MYLDERPTAGLSRTVQDDKSYSIVMIDVVHFPRCNDTYGHASGDTCVRVVYWRYVIPFTLVPMLRQQ
ncbi:diguanylate cyclase domain-containing protein [Telluria mixta]|uniref:diguanylate cyclase domain-containing protein n=1 Tax=Telluria mixta TaxID=34071 RepID=UPI003530D725